MNCALSNWNPKYEESIEKYQLQHFKVREHDFIFFFFLTTFFNQRITIKLHIYKPTFQ